MPSCPNHNTVSVARILESRPTHPIKPTILDPCPCSSNVNYLIPSRFSAFTPVTNSPPAIPPHNKENINRMQEIAELNHRENANKTVKPTPIPLPRLSKMRSLTDLVFNESPIPKPRRKLSDKLEDVHRKMSDKSISRGYSVASVKRRSCHRKNSHKEIQVPEFRIMDDSERDFLKAAVQQTYSDETDSDNNSEYSVPYCHMMRFPKKEMSSPTDSGHPNSDHHDVIRGCSRSDDDGFFDSSNANPKQTEEDGEQSEAMTSISNQQPNNLNASVIKEEARATGPSDLEKHVRVMNWIHSQF